MTKNTTEDQNQTLTPDSLARDHAPAVLGLCLAHTKNLQDAEDMTQETLLKAMTRIDTLHDPKKVRPWLFQIARRLIIDNHRRRTPLLNPLPDQIPAPNPSADPRMEILHRALAKLPEEYREVITIYYLDGRKSAAVAHALEISEPAVRQRLTRARLMLHELLTEDEK